MNKKCKNCHIELTEINAARKSAKYFRNECKPCRSKSVIKSMVGNPTRQKYVREYLRKTGKVKEYPCLSCGKLCIKKYEKAFCSDICRFMSFVDKVDGCWLWQGCKGRRGYGIFAYKGRSTFVASRASYELFKGPIEVGKFVCHLCDIPSCVNPDHLWIGSHVENMLDMVDKGRQHSKLTVSDVYNIRKLWEQGFSQGYIKDKYNITNGTISNIVHRNVWKHI